MRRRAKPAGRHALNDRPLLDQYAAFILDLDGTLARGGSLLPGAACFLRAAHAAGKRLVVLTDNSAVTREDVAVLIRTSGIAFGADGVVTSSYAAAEALRRSHGACRVYKVGSAVLAAELEAMGHQLVTSPPAEAVVLGFADDFSYETLAGLLPILASGAALVVTDEAPVYAARERTLPGAGGLVGAVRGMGFAPEIIAGKPRGLAVDLALNLARSPRADVALIGDSLVSDGEAARHLGVSFVLVLTGVSSRDQAVQAAGPPDHLCDTLAEIACGVGFARGDTRKAWEGE